ncbi:MAG: hypothetical protein JXA57_20385, partial [Armatimonadetes bacterium]|nr:hypothetical protein [Armatimonadota bacterium]
SPTVRCIEDLIASIETGRPTRGNARVARKVMEISMGLVESHRHGGAAVRLPLQDREFYIGSR